MKKEFNYLLKRSAVFVMMLATVSGMAGNLLKNASFEEISPKTNFPMFWAKSSAYKGDISVISDALEAHRGSRSVKVRSVRGDAAIHVANSVRLGNNREVTISVWAKGNGKFLVFHYLYGKRSFLGATKTDIVEVKSNEWKRYEFKSVIPAEYGSKKEKVLGFKSAFHVRTGTISFDDADLRNVSEAQKKTIQKINSNEVKGPYIRIPKTTRGPKIDGKLEKGEWQNAAAITGFLMQGVGKLSPQQSVMYVTYDDKNLYFALKSVVTGSFKKGTTGRDNIKINGEAFEVWVSPQAQRWFQFLGVPAGGYYDISSKEGVKWNSDLKYASHFEDSGETAGGILTFNKTFWTAELSIPLKNLGLTAAPAKGTVWRMNFCRDLAEVKGAPRTVEQWTTWAPTKGHFTATEYFGYVEFGGDCPAVQMVGLGDLQNGLININGKINIPAPGKLKLSSTVKLLDSGKTLLEKDLSLSGKGERPFSLGELIKLSRTADLVLEFTASDPSGAQKYAQARIPFTCRSSFDVKVIPVYTKGFIDIELDTERVAGISKNDKLSINIDGTGISGEKIIVDPSKKIKIRFDISKLKAGDYIVKSKITNAKKQTIVTSAVALTVPKKPEWLGNTIGLSDKVPTPWTPVKTTGKTISVSDRKYLLSDNGLPEQIVSLGKNIFAGKPSLNFVSGGKSVKMKFAPIRNLSAKETKSEWAVKGEGGKLKFEGTLCTEFDGFSLYKFAITPQSPVGVDAVYMDFPIRKDVAMYVRAHAYLPTYKNCSASFYKTFSSAKNVDLAGKWLYNPTWIWNGDFFNSIWVGNDKIGFSLETESDENIKGKKHIEFLTKNDAVIMRVHLISNRMQLDRPLKYEYAWQASPVKPETKNPKKWHASYFARWPEEFSKRLYVGAQYNLCSLSYPKLKTPIKSLLASVHKHNAKVVPDFYLCAAQFNTPEQKLYGSEWEVIPRRSWSNAGFTSPGSSYADFILHTVKCYVEKFGLDGVYLDVSMPVASNNAYHNAGYTDENGKRHPTATIWALRELYKRIYTYLHTDGRDGVIFAHAAITPAFAGFSDVITAGEEWGADRDKYFTRLSPDMFRTKEMHTQHGTPHTFYAFHQYAWRVDKPVSMEEILMMTLPHRILPTVGDKDGGKAIIPFWDLMDNWITSAEFIPYWNQNSPVKTGSETILASVYNKANTKQALVVVSNWGYNASEAKISANFGSKNSGKIKVTQVYPENKVIRMENNKIRLPMKSRGLKIIRIDY